MPLTDTAVKNTKPADKPFKLTDEKSLYLHVMPTGGKLWRMQYRFEGRQKVLAFGAYPDVSLKEARERRDEARKLLANGTDPGAVKKAQKKAVKVEQERQGEIFEKVAQEWLEAWRVDKAPANVERVWGRLAKDVLPWFGKTPIHDIGGDDVLTVCKRIQSRGAIETGHRVLGYLDAIFSRVLAQDAANKDIEEGRKLRRITRNPCTDLRKRNVHMLQPSPAKKHFAHFRDEHTGGVSTARLGEFLRAVDSFKGSYQVLAALRLLPMIFCRPGELRRMKWADVRLEESAWGFDVSKKKPGKEPRRLIVPLPRQAVAILKDLQPLTGNGEYVFQGHWDKGKPMSDAAVNAAIRRLGFDTQKDVSAHGFRHIASTLLYEQGNNSDPVEKSLGHKTRGVKGEYDHAQCLNERAPMYQRWADYLGKLKAGADVIPLRA
ncbi:MAG: integrase arm-type DNA-binding domain-containing protein [Zoogloeaceae bacterium]|jgi:integrase|nr:integrase arm-type DNA-binding domain-containing protein [Zoogloeaceae bacterium]